MKQKKDNFFGYNEEKLREVYNTPLSTPVVNNPKIKPNNTALETLCEGSESLLQEEKTLLKDIAEM